MHLAILSPHLDDAAFSLGLSIGAWLEAGHRVTVLNCFTRSEYAPFADATAIHANDRMTRVSSLRQEEDRQWGRQYQGKLERRMLGLKDAPLRLHCGVDEVCRVPVNLSEKVVTKITRSIAEVAPDVLLVPLALGGHVDHRTAREASALAWTAEQPLGLYEDLPYATRAGVAESIAVAAHEADTPLHAILSMGESDAAWAVKRKRALALCYDSQINHEETEQIATFCVRYGGRERFWANQALLESEFMDTCATIE